jgi:pyridoxamine 5'-phosphate oxidase family protein
MKESIFTAAELEYLQTGRKLARLATVGTDGTPHVTPVGWHLGAGEQVIEVGGTDLAKTKKFRDVERSHKAAIVIDEVLPPWRPRGIEIRGRAEAIAEPGPVIRIYPQRIISWGLDDSGRGLNARDVSQAPS